MFGKSCLNINLSSARSGAGTSGMGSEVDIYDFTDSPRSSDKETSSVKPKVRSKDKTAKPSSSKGQIRKCTDSVVHTPDLSKKNIPGKMKQLKIPNLEFLRKQSEASQSIPLITLDSSSSDADNPKVMRQNPVSGFKAPISSKTTSHNEKCIVLSGDSDIVSDSDNCNSTVSQKASHYVPQSDQRNPRTPPARENVFERFSFGQTDQPTKNNTCNLDPDSVHPGKPQKQGHLNLGSKHGEIKRQVEVGSTSEETDSSSGYKERVPLFENLGKFLDTSVIPETPSASASMSNQAAAQSKPLKTTPQINLSGLSKFSKLFNAKRSPFKKIVKPTTPCSAKKLKLSLKSRAKSKSPSKEVSNKPGSTSGQLVSGSAYQGNNIPASPRGSKRTPTPTPKLQEYLASKKKRKLKSPGKVVPQTVEENCDIVSIPETQESDRTSSIPETQEPDRMGSVPETSEPDRMGLIPETQEPDSIGSVPESGKPDRVASHMNMTPTQIQSAGRSKKMHKRKSIDHKAKGIDSSTESETNRNEQTLSQRRKRKRSGSKLVTREPSERKKDVPAKFKEYVVNETAVSNEHTYNSQGKYKNTPPLRFKRTPKNIKQSSVKEGINWKEASASDIEIPISLLHENRMTSTQKERDARSTLLDSPPRVIESDESDDEGNSLSS